MDFVDCIMVPEDEDPAVDARSSLELAKELAGYGSGSEPA